MPPEVTQSTASFAPADWIVVLIYMAIVTGIGLWTARGQTSQRDYFLGGRSLPWWAVGFSIVATETSALTFIGIPAVAIGSISILENGSIAVSPGNMFFMMTVIGYLTGRLFVILFIIPKYFDGDVYTTYELLNRTFGQRARGMGSALAMVATALGAGVRVYLTAIPVMIVLRTVPALSEIGIFQSVLIIMAAAMIYVALGGIKAVVWTDMLQYFIFVGAGTFALVYIPMLLTGENAAPSGAEGWAAVRELSDGRLRWFNSGFGGENPLKTILSSHNLIAGLIGAPLGIIFAFGFDQMNVQRVLACRNSADGRKAMGLSAIIIGPQFLLFLGIGVCLAAFYALQDWQLPMPPWDPTDPDPVAKADYVFPIFILSEMPIAVKGFFVAAILAAAMSSVSSALGAMGSMAVMDFLRPLRGENPDSRKELLVSRISVGVAGVALIVVAMACRQAPFVFDLAFTLVGLTTGGIMGAFFWGLWKKRWFDLPVIAGMAAAFVFMVFFNLAMQKDIIWNVIWVWHPLIGTTVCMLTIAATSAFLKGRQGVGIR